MKAFDWAFDANTLLVADIEAKMAALLAC